MSLVEIHEDEFDDNIFAPRVVPTQPPFVDLLETVHSATSSTHEDPATETYSDFVPLQIWTRQHDFAVVHQLEFISANRKDASIRPTPLIHVTNNIVQQLIFELNSEASSKLLLFGPSGSGKSTITYMWLQALAVTKPNTPKVWINITDRRLITFYRGYVSVQGGFSIEKFSKLDILAIKVKYRDETNQIRTENRPIGTLVVDGIKKEHVLQLPIVPWAQRIGNVKFITSEQSLPFDLRSSVEKHYCTPPWSLENYLQLCNNEAFFQSVVVQLGGIAGRSYTSTEIERLVRYKYYYAGKNARYMFEYSVKNIQHTIAQAIGRVKNIKQFLLQLVGDNEQGSQDAVNTLVVKHGIRLEILSEYVLRSSLPSTLSRDELSLLHQNDIIRHDPLMNGWTLAADFIYSVRNNLLVESNRVREVVFDHNVLPQVGPTNTTYGSIRCFDMHRNLPDPLSLADIAVGHWFIPEVVLPGGFDSLQVRPSRLLSPFVLRFVHIVCQGTTHTLQIHNMRHCLDKFNQVLQAAGLPPITIIEIIVVYPVELVACVPNPADPAQWRREGMLRMDSLVVEFGVVLFHRLQDV